MPMLQVFAAHGGGEVAAADRDAGRSRRRSTGGPRSRLASRVRPQSETLVMLRGERDVLRAGAWKTSAQWSGSNSSARNMRGEVLVREARAVDALVEGPGAGCPAIGLLAFPLRERVPIPFGIGAAPCARRRRVGWHGVDAPVDEDAELGVGEPGRRGPAVEHPSWAGTSWRPRTAARAEQEQKN